MINNLVEFLTNPTVVLIILPIISLLFLTSLFTPSIGVGETVGSILILAFFVAHFIGGYTSIWTVLLFVLGVILIIVELVIPGMIVGFIGLVAIILSILFSGVSLVITSYAVAAALAVAIIGMVVMVKIFGKKLSVFNRMVLNDSTDTEQGYVSNVNRTELLNQVGVTVTPLRPSGVAMLDGERLDVVSEGSFIDIDKKVIIIKVEGSRIVVRENKD